MSADYSRALRLGSLAAEDDETSLRERVEAAQVHVTADIELPGVAAALPVLIADLRRFPVTLSFDPAGGDSVLSSAIIDDLQQIAVGIDADRPLQIGRSPREALHVHLGARPPSTARISAVPDGHGARLRRAGRAFPTLNAAGTGLGAVLAAALLTGEAFKVITALRPTAHRPADILDFCPVTISGAPGGFAGLPAELPALALVGAGAIGTAVALILDNLGLSGSLAVVDPQEYEPPNVITYSLGTLEDARARVLKVQLLARHLPGFDVLHVHGTAQTMLERIDDGTAPWPGIVLGAVDSIDARHELQRIYADLTLDGSTGGRAGTTLALREGTPLGPCVRCYYRRREASAGPSTEQRLHDVTGLPIARIARGDDPLTAADIRDLAPDQRERLLAHLGKPVCGLGRLLGLAPGAEDGYRPSAAFVAQQAACLVVGGLLARTTGLITGAMRDLEYDAL